jgi:hypothetical protein
MCARWIQAEGCSNGPTEAVNLLIKKVKRVGHGFATSATTGCAWCCTAGPPGRRIRPQGCEAISNPAKSWVRLIVGEGIARRITPKAVVLWTFRPGSMRRLGYRLAPWAGRMMRPLHANRSQAARRLPKEVRSSHHWSVMAIHIEVALPFDLGFQTHIAFREVG